MRVGLLIITHDGIGAAVLGTATFILGGDCPLATRLLSATRDCDPNELVADALEAINELDNGAGVLILTDLYGATPSNIARALAERADVRTVSGLNLSMLMHVLNYPGMNLDQLAHKAVKGGREGVILITNNE